MLTKVERMAEMRDCVDALEALTAELAEARSEVEMLRKWSADMVAKAASGGALDGYRSMGREILRLRQGLEAIAALSHSDTCSNELTDGMEGCDCHRAVARLALIEASEAREAEGAALKGDDT